MENTPNMRQVKTLIWDRETDIALDFAYAAAPPNWEAHGAMIDKALADMRDLESGGIANPDEGRMVGHYWLRNPRLAPSAEVAAEIQDTNAAIIEFVRRVHSGEIVGVSGKPFRRALVIGVGGSSLGTRFVAEALKTPADRLELYFIDNTDPDGIDTVLAEIEPDLAETMVIVISKSGGTVETQNGLVEVQAYFAAHKLDFYANAVRITQPGSTFANALGADRWLAAFPMWEWVGGRTSVMSAVGLLPLALQGVDIRELLQGAAACDELGRRASGENLALQLALFWYEQTEGKGGSLMAVLPYKDRLALFAKYLQQLVMESIGKEQDLQGNTVRQGLAVLGNKGSTDQHSYVQQLVAGPNNAFAVFIEVLRDREGASVTVREDSTGGDYLQAFMLGTARALREHGKNSVIITVPVVSPFYVGMLIALFERAVGFYASFVGINAYHQPAVEFGKKAADELIAVKNQLLKYLRDHKGNAFSANELAAATGVDNSAVWHILRHLAANGAVRAVCGEIGADTLANKVVANKEEEKFTAVVCDDK